MKKILLTFIVFISVFVGLWYFNRPHPSVNTLEQDPLQGFTKSSYTYTASPTLQIEGVKYVVPESFTKGTNLARDTYVSRESIPDVASCSGDAFFDGTHDTVTVTDPENNVTYSVATSSGAGAGNRYEEVVYAVPGSNPCIGIRFFIHYGVLQNYEEGTVVAFDENALIDRLDRVRRALYPIEAGN